MRQLVFIVTLLLLSNTVFGQQLPQYTQWYMNQFAMNPAHAGIRRCIDVHALFRTQWVGFEGAPKSGFFTASIPIHVRRKQYLSARHGTGFKFERDRIGQLEFNRLNIAYAGHFNFSKHKRLSLGLYGGIVQFGYDPSTVHTTESDPAILNQVSTVAPDASFGAWFNDENYFLSFTAQNLIPFKWRNIGIDARSQLHLSAQAGYRYSVNEDMSLIPAMNIRVPIKGKTSVDLNLHWDYRNLLGLGLGYRNTDALLVFVSLKIKGQFALVYSFDYTLSKLQQVSKNTHEVSLRFSTCKIKKSGTASCPLF